MPYNISKISANPKLETEQTVTVEVPSGLGSLYLETEAGYKVFFDNVIEKLNENALLVKLYGVTTTQLFWQDVLESESFKEGATLTLGDVMSAGMASVTYKLVNGEFVFQSISEINTDLNLLTDKEISYISGFSCGGTVFDELNERFSPEEITEIECGDLDFTYVKPLKIKKFVCENVEE